MSGQQKRGFRLPWAAEQRGSDETSAAMTVDQGTLDSAPAAVGDELGDGPFVRAESEPAKTADTAPAASDVPESSAEAEMIDTDEMQDRIDRAMGDGVWPTTAQAEETTAEAEGTNAASEDLLIGASDDAATEPPEATNGGHATTPRVKAAEPAPRSSRRENPLVAGLVKAMREAAVASRAETTTRLQAEAAARIEKIRAESTEEAAALRKRVDDDIASIRDWSKGEMARIRAETEHRIETRRADAIEESQHEQNAMEQLVERVQATVAGYESDMDKFFEELLAENDPAKLASLAEQAPEPPDLSGELPTSLGWTSFDVEPDEELVADDATPDDTEAVAEAEVETATEAVAETEAVTEASEARFDATDTETADDDAGPVMAAADGDALGEARAAEAEAEATEGLDLSNNNEWPASVLQAARRAEPAPAPSDGESDTIRLAVSGLTSVAGISAFKGAVSGLEGVHSVSVSTGERGVFIFTVDHVAGMDVGAAVTGLTAFSVKVNEATADRLAISAHEPAAA